MSPERAAALTFYYDLSSPYAYLGATQVERVAREAGAVVKWRPILVGALFNAIGTPMVPMNEMPAPKRAYVVRDLMHFASSWGVPFKWPTLFPMRTVAALRLALATEKRGGDIAEISLKLFRAYWAEGRDISNLEVLREFGDVAANDDPGIKGALRANTDEAVAAGVCGVPSFVARGHLFWGQDRLDLVARVLSGWDPPK